MIDFETLPESKGNSKKNKKNKDVWLFCFQVYLFCSAEFVNGKINCDKGKSARAVMLSIMDDISANLEHASGTPIENGNDHISSGISPA